MKNNLISEITSIASCDKSAVDSNNCFARIGFDGNSARLGWVNPPEFQDIKKVLSKFSDLAKDKEYFIFVGMGGSVNGVKVLSRFDSKEQIYALDSLDPLALEEILLQIDDLNKVLVIALSKSSTTKETQLLAYSLKTVLPGKDNFLWVIDHANQDKLFSFGWDNVNILSLQIDQREDVGGRFSSPHTLVFLLPLFIVLNQSLEKTEQIWNKYISYKQDILNSALNCALKYEKLSSAFFFVNIKEEFVKEFTNWIVQLFNESLGSKKDNFEVKTFVLSQGLNKQGFHGVSLEVPIDDPLVYLMANMYFLELFVAFFSCFKDITFVNQPYVEVYKKKMKELQNEPGIASKSCSILELVAEVKRKISKKQRFIEIVLYFHPWSDIVDKIKDVFSEEFSDKDIIVFVGSDWNHHSYQAAFKDQETFYVILGLEKYFVDSKFFNNKILKDNLEALKTITYATYKTIEDKAIYRLLKK